MARLNQIEHGSRNLKIWSSLMTSEAYRMKVLQNNFSVSATLISCRYDLLRPFVAGCWFCSYDFDMIWYGCGHDFEMSQHCDWDVGEKCENNSKLISDTYGNHIRSTSRSPQNRINTIWMSKPYQHDFQTDHHVKNQSLGCFCFLSWSQLVGNREKGAEFSHSVSKSNHIQETISETWQNHMEIAKCIKFISSNHTEAVLNLQSLNILNLRACKDLNFIIESSLTWDKRHWFTVGLFVVPRVI